MQPEEPWGSDGRSPTFAYCDCCGTEFGYQDATLEGVLRQRARWLEGGAEWARPSEQPPGWDLEAQLAAIPGEWQAS